jgi:hypothetical protein
VVATKTVVIFGWMFRYNNAPQVLWWNARFETDGSGFGRLFDKRMNAQYRQGNKVLVAASPLVVVCPAGLMRELQIYTDRSEDMHVFRGFNGRMVAKSPRTLRRGLSKSPTTSTSDF